jgi:hypothetical protein
MGWLVNATPPAALHPARIVQEAVWFGRVRKISPPPTGIRSRTVQSVASPYTDWAILAHRIAWYQSNRRGVPNSRTGPLGKQADFRSCRESTRCPQTSSSHLGHGIVYVRLPHSVWYCGAFANCGYSWWHRPHNSVHFRNSQGTSPCKICSWNDHKKEAHWNSKNVY